VGGALAQLTRPARAGNRLTAGCPRADDARCAPLGNNLLSYGRVINRFDGDAHALTIGQVQRLLQ
jgi:hypothetical protein